MMMFHFIPETVLSGVRRNHEPRFPVNIGITGYVASTGEVRTVREISVCYVRQSLKRTIENSPFAVNCDIAFDNYFKFVVILLCFKK